MYIGTPLPGTGQVGPTTAGTAHPGASVLGTEPILGA